MLLVATQYTHGHNDIGTEVMPFGGFQRLHNLFYADAKF